MYKLEFRNSLNKVVTLEAQTLSLLMKDFVGRFSTCSYVRLFKSTDIGCYSDHLINNHALQATTIKILDRWGKLDWKSFHDFLHEETDTSSTHWVEIT